MELVHFETLFYSHRELLHTEVSSTVPRNADRFQMARDFGVFDADRNETRNAFVGSYRDSRASNIQYSKFER